MKRARGFTLVEVLLAVALTAVLALSLGGVVTTALSANTESRGRHRLAQEAHFAMARITAAVRASPVLVVPFPEDPGTGNSESVIDPGFLALRLDPTRDRDRDGFADADNDKDGRVDEDFPADSNRDGMPGIRGIDDDNSGITDFSFAGSGDDDETGVFGGGGEDPIDGVDNDGDAAIDEDPPADMNGDGAPGVLGVDDDGDGSVDEGAVEDDDEDGTSDEDWEDSVVFFATGTDLVERHPNLDPADGNDYTERTIASGVSEFRVERLPRGDNRVDLVEIRLVLGTDPDAVTLTQRIRVGQAP